MMEDPEDKDDDNRIVMMSSGDLQYTAALLTLIATGQIDDSDMERVGRCGSKPGDAKKLQIRMQKEMAKIMKVVNASRAEGN
jgi:hypothetical protein